MKRDPMFREIIVILCMVIGFAITAWLMESPGLSLLVAILAGMWADLRMER